MPDITTNTNADLNKLLEKGIALGQAITAPQMPIEFDSSMSAEAAARVIGALSAGRTMKPFILKPAGYEVVALDYLIPQTNPLHAEAAPNLQSAGSFIAYVNRFAQDGKTVVFANMNQAKLTAIVDYHETKQANFGKHVAHFQPAKSTQWEMWASNSGKPKSQSDFAELIEGARSAIASPAPPRKGIAADLASLLEVTRGLQAKTEVNWSAGVRLKDGTNRLSFSEEVKGMVTTGNVEIPDGFEILVPIFFGSTPQRVECQFRFSMKAGQLSLMYVIHEKTEIEQKAFEVIVDEIAAGINAPLFAGAAS